MNTKEPNAHSSRQIMRSDGCDESFGLKKECPVYFIKKTV